MSKFLEHRTITVQKFRYEKIDENGCSGSRSVPDGEVDIVISIEIDLDNVARYMGKNAYHSKGKRSRDGAVEVRFIREVARRPVNS